MVHGPAVPVSLGNLLEMQTLRLYLRPTESETLGVKPRSLNFNKPPVAMDASYSLRTTILAFYIALLIKEVISIFYQPLFIECSP